MDGVNWGTLNDAQGQPLQITAAGIEAITVSTGSSLCARRYWRIAPATIATPTTVANVPLVIAS